MAELSPQWRRPNSRGFYGYSGTSFQGLSFGDALYDAQYNALKNSPVGLYMDDATIRASVAINLAKQAVADPGNVALASAARAAVDTLADPAVSRQANAILTGLAHPVAAASGTSVASVVNQGYQLLNTFASGFKPSTQTGPATAYPSQATASGPGPSDFNVSGNLAVNGKKIDPKLLAVGAAGAALVLLMLLRK